MADRLFTHPRLAEAYDALDSDRSDLEAYAAIITELGARSVLDVGCGTGTFAVMLAAGGLHVVGVDPAAASLRVAGAKPGADAVDWVNTGAETLPDVEVDVVTMTGNVAQVFVTDVEWSRALHAVHRVLRPGGHLVFEMRDPAAEAWRTWTRAGSYRCASIAGVGDVESWVDVTDVTEATVSFRTTFVFVRDGAVLTSDSTLRFRQRDEVVDSLHAAGFADPEVRDAPDRPGLELVFLARRQH